MKKFNVLLFMAFAAALLMYCAPKEKYRTKTDTDKKGYTYEYVTNDPLQARIYTLKNGLKVYLTVNKDKPEIQTLIAVKAGSTYDPPQTTGLAHYLEHLMFKGTEKIGTADWQKEKVMLDQLSALFEQHRNSTNADEKKALYKKIDSVSFAASKYAIAGEYDKMLSSIGATNTNAYTTNERTVYMNTIPSNVLEKWMVLESERFSSLVLRLFHTELETVYEEFNMSQDRDETRADNALKSGLFAKHPYGTQTTIGKGEHLKNPSMINIHNYWKTYYVPNNMAVCMSGDLDFEETIKLVDKYFGKMKPNDNIPKFVSPVENPIKEPVVKEVLGPEQEYVMIAFRFNGIKTQDRDYVSLIDNMLSNSQAGLIDLDLVQNQKVLDAGAYSYFLKDYGVHLLYGYPREKQTLEQVKDLLLAEIEKIKKGTYEDWLPGAVINDFRLNETRQYESNWRASAFVSAFSNSIDWKDYLGNIDRMEKITKQQLMEFASKNYLNNYVVVYKRTGVDTTIMKLEKPPITPIELNRESQSAFLKEYAQIKTKKVEPVFINFEEKIAKTKLQSGIELSYIKNVTNELFNLEYIIDMGKNHIKMLPLAVEYLPYIGTDKYTPAQLQQEFFKLGLNMGVYADDERSYVYISGLEKSFDKGMELLEHVLTHAKPDQQIYNDYVDGILKERADAKLDKEFILWDGLYNYGKYGKNSSFTNIYSTDELKKIKPEELTNLIKDIYSYKHKLFYYGQNDINNVKSTIDKYHKIPSTLKNYPAPVKYPELSTNRNKVYFVNYDMTQANIVFIAKDQLFDKNLMPVADLFNEYYGGNMSSIVFQEIREAKGLAYSAYGGYSIPDKPDKSHYTFAFVATQVDKLKTATTAMTDLMNNLLKSQKQFDLSKESIIKKIENERIIKSNIFWVYQNNQDKGINYDIRKDVYEFAKKATIDDINKFFDEHIKGKKYTFLIIGNKNDLDLAVLKSLGEVQELTLEEIFNY